MPNLSIRFMKHPKEVKKFLKYILQSSKLYDGSSQKSSNQVANMGGGYNDIQLEATR